MSKRLHPTLADYLVIAVSPALIMALVGSLVFFLLDILYQGQYPERLHFVFALFVMAAVLVGRISIEMGSSHAMMYAAPLAIVTVLALQRFVQYPGDAAAYSLWVNVGLVGLILWCANKLTWDCTFIDESAEESGEGVLRTMGLDPPNAKKSPQTSEVLKTSEVSGAKEIADGVSAKPRPHSGGVWVVYFSLAALPLFGIGQRFLPVENMDRRRYAFLLLCVYVGSALGLLLTTSFLGLRRYLRGRRLQMPATMAGAWVVTGCILIAAILSFAVLLPRPSPEYAISEVPWSITSEKRSASRYAVGKEGTEDSRKDSPHGEDHRPADAKKSGQPADGSKDVQQKGQTQGAKDGAGADRSGNDRGHHKATDAEAPKGSGSQRESSGQDAPQSGKAGDGKSADSPRPAGNAKGGSQQQGKSGAAGEQKGSQGQAKGSESDEPKGSQDQAKASSPGGQKGPQEQQQGRSSAGQKIRREPRADSKRDAKSQDADKGDPPQPQTPQAAPQPPSPSWNFSLSGILKWLFYLALIVAVAYFGWRSRAALAQAWRDFLETLRAFWASLFGPKGGPKQAAAGEAASEAKAAPRPFADYADPFAAGWAERWPPDELIRYSFAALEAWAREHGCPRGPEQTPHEFANNVGDRSNRLKSHCRKMADLYSRAAYASGTLPPTSAASLREFWQQLTSA
jgi:hypothetical protein